MQTRKLLLVLALATGASGLIVFVDWNRRDDGGLPAMDQTPHMASPPRQQDDPRALPPADEPVPQATDPRSSKRAASTEVERLVDGLLARADYWSIGPRASECLAEVERRLTEGNEDSRPGALLSIYRKIAFLQGVETTPPIILDVARHGPPARRLTALKVLGQIADEAAVEVLAEALDEALALDPKGEEELRFGLAVVQAAGETHSEYLAQKLTSFVGSTHPVLKFAAIKAIGSIGFGAQADFLRELAEDSASKDVKGAVVFALSKIEPLQAPDRGERLMELIESGTMSGEFSWYEWALRKLVYLRSTDQVPGLRAMYDKYRDTMTREATTSFAFSLLSAIHKLGGSLSPEEIDLLESAGRLP